MNPLLVLSLAAVLVIVSGSGWKTVGKPTTDRKPEVPKLRPKGPPKPTPSADAPAQGSPPPPPHTAAPPPSAPLDEKPSLPHSSASGTAPAQESPTTATATATTTTTLTPLSTTPTSTATTTTTATSPVAPPTAAAPAAPQGPDSKAGRLSPVAQDYLDSCLPYAPDDAARATLDNLVSAFEKIGYKGSATTFDDYMRELAKSPAAIPPPARGMNAFQSALARGKMQPELRELNLDIRMAEETLEQLVKVADQCDKQTDLECIQSEGLLIAYSSLVRSEQDYRKLLLKLAQMLKQIKPKVDTKLSLDDINRLKEEVQIWQEKASGLYINYLSLSGRFKLQNKKVDDEYSTAYSQSLEEAKKNPTRADRRVAELEASIGKASDANTKQLLQNQKKLLAIASAEAKSWAQKFRPEDDPLDSLNFDDLDFNF